MGKLQHTNLPTNVKWAPEGGWCISLGIPIGNNINQEKWWKKKIISVRHATKKWKGLLRSTYFGRNLITQSMYLGKLRYWLYSITPTKELNQIIQKDVDILNWARTPELQTDDENLVLNTKRIKRWIAKDTAIGPRNKGGLNNLSWQDHANKFLAQWVIRYLQPGETNWKKILDQFLLYDRYNQLKYPEGRRILICNLTEYQKTALLNRLPKTAKYFKQCLKEFWNLHLSPILTNDTNNIRAEPIWHNYRFTIDIPHHDIAFCKKYLKLIFLGDLYQQGKRIITNTGKHTSQTV